MSSSLLLLLLLIVVPAFMLEFRYHSNGEMEQYLLQVNASNPDIAHLYSIGRTVRGNFLFPDVSVLPAAGVWGTSESPAPPSWRWNGPRWWPSGGRGGSDLQVRSTGVYQVSVSMETLSASFDPGPFNLSNHRLIIWANPEHQLARVQTRLTRAAARPASGPRGTRPRRDSEACPDSCSGPHYKLHL